MVILLWPQANQRGLLIWSAIMLVAVPAPSVMKRVPISFATWYRLLAPTEIAIGAMWGSIALLAMPRTPVWQVILGTALMGIMLTGAAISSQFLRGHVCFSGTFFASCALGYVLFGIGPARIMLWILGVGFGFGFSLSAELRAIHVELVAASRQNRDLVATLEVAYADANQANQQLASAITVADRLARTDPLTQLSNRMGFEEELDRQLARLRDGQITLTIAFIDLDGFKLVNDTHGHEAGDRLLSAVATRLHGIRKSNETLARLGGDELVLISNAVDADAVGARLVSAFAAPFVVDGRTLEVTGSVGVASVTQPIQREALLAQADTAQYAAKRSGGHGHVVFVHGIHNRAQREEPTKPPPAR